MALIGGDMFNATWSIGQKQWSGVAFRDGNVLSSAWSAKANDANVMAYLVTSSGLDGVWFEAGGTKLGNEYLSPKGRALTATSLAGDYTIARGKNPDGSSYSGTAKITRNAGSAAEVYLIDWTLGTAHTAGVCLRSSVAGTADVLTCGFADSGTEFGALSYVVSGDGSLAGRWVQSVAGKVATGAENATPAH